MDKLTNELNFLKKIIPSEYAINNLTVLSKDENIYSFEINNQKYQCVISYLKDFNIFLLTTTRENNKTLLTFEAEFWFEQNYTSHEQKGFNKIISDFTTKESKILLDQNYACQIEYQ